jgi:hypothetical protein
MNEGLGSTENEKLVRSMSLYDRKVVAEGLSSLLKRPIADDADSVLQELSSMSSTYGGYGLISVMDWARNNI